MWVVHKGGYDPFSYDVTSYLTSSGPQELIVRVYSPEDTLGIPRGKQTLHPGVHHVHVFKRHLATGVARTDGPLGSPKPL